MSRSAQNLCPLRFATRAVAFAACLSCAILPGISASAQSGQRKWVVTSSPSASSGKRVALVMGNTHYEGSNSLKNPENDARAVAHTLSALGFDVLLCLDRTNKQMDEDIQAFHQKVEGASVALFYYSGHGSQLDGENYLIPIGFEGSSESAIKYDAVNVARVLDALGDSKTRVNVVILDACRDNPFASGSRSLAHGLAPVNAPGGTLICYSTGPGKTAADNPTGSNGLYTAELLQQMKTPGLRIEDVFINTNKAVRLASGGKQVPWEESSLEEPFYFIAPSGGAGGNLLKTMPASKMPASKAVLSARPIQVVDSIPKGTTKTNPRDAAEMVYVPAGPFEMGDADVTDNPRHEVALSGYYIYKNLVTVAMYRKFCDETKRHMPHPPGWGWRDDNPVVNVSWADAKAYCDWAGARLPTEAEWEKAARGTDARKFPWGNEWNASNLWCAQQQSGLPGQTHAVGAFVSGASPCGALDMSGNVTQWCEDWYDPSFWTSNHATVENPVNDTVAEARVIRGGSCEGSDGETFRISTRLRSAPLLVDKDGGFRAVVSGDGL